MFLLDDSQMELFLPYFQRVLEHGDMNRETLQIYNVRHELIDLIIETAAFLWVVMVVDEGPGGWEQCTNESLWLIDGRWRARRTRLTHQQVIGTCWWSWWSTKGQEGENNSPMSCCDLLVVDKGPGGWEKCTNKSLWLVGGCGGWQRTRRARTAHQQVVMTHQWSMKGWEGEVTAPMSHHDLLVVMVVNEGLGGR